MAKLDPCSRKGADAAAESGMGSEEFSFSALIQSIALSSTSPVNADPLASDLISDLEGTVEAGESNSGWECDDHFEPEQFPASDIIPVSVSTSIGAALQSLTVPSPAPIWEQGIWGCIFGDKEFGDCFAGTRQAFDRPLPSARLPDESVVGEVLPSAKRLKIGDASFHWWMTFAVDSN